MKKTWLAGILSAASLFAAEALDLSGYKALPKSGTSENLIKNPSFLEGDKYWDMKNCPEFEIGPFGPNNVPALRQVRSGKRKGSSPKQVLKLKPKTTYRFGALMCPMDLKRRRSTGQIVEGRAAVSISWLAKGRGWVWGTMTCGMHGADFGVNNQWKRVEYSFTTPDNPDYIYHYYPTMSEVNLSGAACWTNLFLEEALARCIFYMIHPKMSALSDGSDEVEVAISVEGTFQYPQKNKAELSCAADIVDAKGRKIRSVDAKVIRERAVFHVGKLPAGEYSMELKLADTANKYILDSGTLPLNIVDPATRPANYTGIDRYGRAIRNGKPFLPLGTYTWAILEEDLKYLHDAGFNLIMPYGMLFNYIPKYGRNNGAEPLRAALDIAHKYGMLVSANVQVSTRPATWDGLADADAIRKRLIETCKDHPALFSYYISDEPSPVKNETLCKQRAMINKMDPWHPTWAVFNAPDEMPKLANAMDIASIDPYPIRGAVHDQNIVVDQTRIIQKVFGNLQGSGAYWMVPQMFSWSCFTKSYKKTLKPEYAEKCKKAVDIPTEREMLSMALMGAIYGVKGYVFYEYQQLKAKPLRERMWESAKGMIKTLKAQSDLILGIRPAPAVQIKKLKGEVHAKAFLGDNDAKGIFIAAVGPGESEAEITIPEYKGLKSVIGNCTETAPGVYLFKGKGIDCDILR